MSWLLLRLVISMHGLYMKSDKYLFIPLLFKRWYAYHIGTQRNL